MQFRLNTKEVISLNDEKNVFLSNFDEQIFESNVKSYLFCIFFSAVVRNNQPEKSKVITEIFSF